MTQPGRLFPLIHKFTSGDAEGIAQLRRAGVPSPGFDQVSVNSPSASGPPLRLEGQGQAPGALQVVNSGQPLPLGPPLPALPANLQICLVSVSVDSKPHSPYPSEDGGVIQSPDPKAMATSRA